MCNESVCLNHNRHHWNNIEESKHPIGVGGWFLNNVHRWLGFKRNLKIFQVANVKKAFKAQNAIINCHNIGDRKLIIIRVSL
jgi:hypothetical protein